MAVLLTFLQYKYFPVAFLISTFLCPEVLPISCVGPRMKMVVLGQQVYGFSMSSRSERLLELTNF